MAAKSSIEWTEHTWNPVTGCTKISPGCKFCYAERLAHRLQAMGVNNYRNGFKVTLHEHMLETPLRWKKPTVVFVNSMSDLFHEDVPDNFILKIFEIMNRRSLASIPSAHEAAGTSPQDEQGAAVDAKHLDGHERRKREILFQDRLS